jgi:ABC-type multidrug transport system ATPase subunit
VRSLTLRLAPGQVLGLLGPNGSGKSTTLKALAGLIAPSAGTCRVFGHAAGSDAARALAGYLPESPQFSPHQSGRGFLEYCAGLSSLAATAAARRVDEVLRWSGLADAAEQGLGTYSKGMTQRLGLAQAILHEPPLLLLDEPASGLDPEGRLALNRLIRDLAAHGTTVVFSSHLLAQAEEVCDRFALLGRGRLLAEGTPAELLGTARPANPEPSRLEKLYLEKLRENE